MKGIYGSLTSGIILSIKWEWMAHVGKENCTLCKISFGTKMCSKAIKGLLLLPPVITPKNVSDVDSINYLVLYKSIQAECNYIQLRTLHVSAYIAIPSVSSSSISSQ